MHSDPLYVFRAFRAGVSGYVTKDAEGSEIISAARTVHEGGKHLSPPMAESFINDYVLRNNQEEIGNLLSRLSPREREILGLVSRGYSSPDIAALLSLSVHTVNTHRRNAMGKLDAQNSAEAVRYAAERGLI